jgi:hypothetical protein
MNTMKTKTRTLIGIVALGLVGITNINATTADNKRIANAEVVIENEESLAIESWMTDDNYWISDSGVGAQEVEEALQIESWMTNESNWTSDNKVNATEGEKSLEIESWMVKESLWK